jgi:hypothetical protein
VLDELRREAMAAVAERSHADILSDTPLAPDQVSVTMPVKRKGARRHSRPLSHEAAGAISPSKCSDDNATVGFGSAEGNLAGWRP